MVTRMYKRYIDKSRYIYIDILRKNTIIIKVSKIEWHKLQWTSKITKKWNADFVKDIIWFSILTYLQVLWRWFKVALFFSDIKGTCNWYIAIDTRGLSQYKYLFQGICIKIFIINIRWSWDHFIFITIIPIMVRRYLYIVTAASWANTTYHMNCSLFCMWHNYPNGKFDDNQST